MRIAIDGARRGKNCGGSFIRSAGFCYNASVKRCFFLFCAVVPLLLSVFPAPAFAEQAIPDFILQLQQDLSARRLEAYLEAYAPVLRPSQRSEFNRYFDELKMDSVVLTWANKRNFDPADPILFLQVLCQNSFSALIETWELKLEESAGRWQVREKSARGNVSQLYKIRLPAERIERAESVEITHADFRLTFRDALVFYDNIPGLETALLVVGDGRLVFSPSDAGEKHQLSLLYKKKVLEDRIDHAFLRFSNTFFNQNIRLTGSVDASASADGEKARRKAEAIFPKYLGRYFTIQSPLSREPLSFLPQGEETVIQFHGRKTGEMAYVFSPLAEEEITLFDTARERFINLYSPVLEEEARRLVITFSPKYDIRDYDIELDFQPQDYFISARAQVGLVSQVESLDVVKLKFHPGLEILRIYDSERRELIFTKDPVGRILYVYFLEPVSKNERTTIEVFYRGRLEPPPQLTDVVSGQRFEEAHEPMPVRFETILFSQAAQWYPATLIDDFFTARLRIIVPPAYSVISNGVLVEKSVLNGVQRVTEIDKVGSSCSIYETKRPVKYLSFLVGKLSLTQETAGPPPLAAYASSDVRSVRKNLLTEARRILEFYESRFGAYPFENLSIVQRLWRTTGGHSPASFVILNDLPRVPNPGTGIRERLMGNPDSPVDLSPQWREYFLAHEIAHQWWGQGVTWARYRDQWLSEGLSQYASVLYLQSKYGEDARTDILKKFSRWTVKKSVWGPITMGSRLSFTNFDAYQAIIYDKTALVLNMLRDLLGDEVFFSGLKAFFEEHKHAAASTGQFRRTFEAASGQDLNAFFGLWFDSHLLPAVQVRAQVDKRETGVLLKITVNQLNADFVFPLWVAWEDGPGAPHREMLIVDRKNKAFEFPLPGSLRKLEVNPDRAVPGEFQVIKD
ncbi:MAG: pepN 3 [Candidatus Aminicenantes bacterium]|nr:pepN 3 [Candidatus Aminicenantes bacterium]